MNESNAHMPVQRSRPLRSSASDWLAGVDERGGRYHEAFLRRRGRQAVARRAAEDAAGAAAGAWAVWRMHGTVAGELQTHRVTLALVRVLVCGREI